MADVFSKEKRSEVMSKLRGRNTKPELLVRKFIFSQGFRFRLYPLNLPGKPDIVLPKFKTLIFVNGCFWHGHTNCKHYTIPTTRMDYWRDKIEKNKARDIKINTELKSLGWRLITIWTCEIRKNNPNRLVELADDIRKVW